MNQLISALARHRVAPDVLMLIVFLAGAWALSRINIQFFPTFELQYISVSASWPGASAEDVEKSLVEPLESQLRGIKELSEMVSSSRDGVGSIYLEFPDHTDIDEALDLTKQKTDSALESLPNDIDAPAVTKLARYDNVARVSISGSNASELRSLARDFETELLGTGIGRIDISGIAKEEIHVLVDDRRLIELGLTFSDIGRRIALENRDDSAGKIESATSQYQLRTLSKHEDVASLGGVPIKTLPDGAVIRLRDVATITRRPRENMHNVSFDGRPAVEFRLQRNLSDNILDSARIANEWVGDKRQELPPSIGIVAHDQSWVAVQDRLQLLLKNGMLGLILVIATLFLFLSGRVALWIAVGIPIAFMACLTIFGMAGGTINMISMFALIMATGIIVDDSIVIGENFLRRIERGDEPLRASVRSAKRMFVPILASSLTTISSFIPLFAVGGVIGAIIFDIPFIIVCVIIAALLECFLILPGHLYASFRKRPFKKAENGIRHRFNNGFNRFKEKVFRPAVTWAVRYRGTTVVSCFAMMVLSIGLMANGFVRYSFFPGADLNVLNVNMTFFVGTPDNKMIEFTRYLESTIPALEEELGDKDLVKHVSVYYGARPQRGSPRREGVQMRVELQPGDEREISLDQVAEAWRKKIELTPETETFVISGQRGGPPGSDIEFDLLGDSIDKIKAASLELQSRLENTPGTKRISDDLPFGKQQLIFNLSPLGRRLGLDVNDVSSQLRAAYDGSLAQVFTEGVDEIEVRVMLADERRLDPSYLYQLPIRLPNGEFAALGDLVTLTTRRGFDSIQHINGQAAVKVNADIDSEITSVDEVIAQLNEGDFLNKLEKRHEVSIDFSGKGADEQQTIKDMQFGFLIMLVLIFIILTWVFSSWSTPLVIMLTMPFGVIGSVIGHWVMGLTLSILSFFGIFTLAGIIVNNSIILISFYQDLIKERPDEDLDQLIVEASCLRLRPVLITSITTIAGLLPLVAETSTQAQFLIPMAVSIGFGLLFATLLILLFTPACLSFRNSLVLRRSGDRPAAPDRQSDAMELQTDA